ncbi:hypothetical protein GCM10009799_09240 [Nocardiopsis rhodophaea]|uniref:Major facilitator superfamily (MFS) profile domain-containing protein n=1 Tax=Nocardiopsis rhodophaea TaxID=280238 RepID=A0ABN2SFZ2_9ACTN
MTGDRTVEEEPAGGGHGGVAARPRLLGAFPRPAAFWCGFLVAIAGVALHLPMFVSAAPMDYRMAGMPMDPAMYLGMALIIAGQAATAYGLVPRGRARGRTASGPRIRPDDGAPLNRAHITLVAVLVTAVTVDAMKPITLGFVAPGMTAEYGLRSPLNPDGALPVALLPLSGLTGTVIGSFLWGSLADRIGRRSAILLAGVLFVTTAVCGAMPSFTWNLVMCALMGVAAGGMLPITFSLLAETIPARHRGWVMVLIGGTPAIAYALTGWLAAELMPDYSWRVMWLIGAPTGALLIVLNRWIPESPRFLLLHGRTREAARVMATYGATATPSPEPGTGPGPEPESPASPTTPTVAGPGGTGGYGPLFRFPFTGFSSAVLIFGLGIGLVTYGFQLWIPTNLRVLGLDAQTADRALRDAAFLGLPLIGAAAALYALWSAQKTLIGLGALVTAAMAVFALVGEALAEGGALYLLLAVPIAGTAVLTAVLTAYTSELYPTRLRSRGCGLCAGAGKIGGVAVSAVLVAGLAIPSVQSTSLLGLFPLLAALITFYYRPAPGTLAPTAR